MEGRRAWPDVPPALGPVLRRELRTLADACIAAIREEVPEYHRPMTGDFGRGIRDGVVSALERFVVVIEDHQAGLGEVGGVYRLLGHNEWHAGRSLDALQAAYRVGARVAWRHAARAGLAAGIEPAALHLLAEAIFAYIDELAAESVAGYAEAQAAAAGERQERRARLVALMLADPPPDPAVLGDAAEVAGWTLPSTVAAVAAPRAEPAALARHLPSDALVGVVDGACCVLLPDPDGPGRAAQLTRALGESPAAIGPAVRPAEAARSWRRARRLARLVDMGALADRERPVRADDHLADLVLTAEPTLMADLGRRRLAPFADLTPRARERMEETLAALLAHQGAVADAAAALHVHPQTVRYRVARLRELLGDALDDPHARFELELVLRARALLGGA